MNDAERDALAAAEAERDPVLKRARQVVLADDIGAHDPRAVIGDLLDWIDSRREVLKKLAKLCDECREAKEKL